MKPKSLFSRLLFSHAVIIVIALVLLGGMFNYLLQHYLSKTRQTQFEKIAKNMANTALLKQSIQNEDIWTLDSLIKQVGQSAETDVVIVNNKDQVLASTTSRTTNGTLNNTAVKSVLNGAEYSHWGGSFLGVPSLTVGFPIKVKRQVIGAVFLDAPLKGFQASLFRFRLLILYAALLALVFAVLVAYVLAKSISRPILQMSRSAKDLARGKNAKIVDYQGQDELGTLVAVFNRSVQEVQKTLLQQQKLEEQRREFVANVSHEFRAPVASLQGFLELMQDGKILEQDRPKYYELMLRDTSRLNRLVTDLLDLARFQAGQAKIKPIPLDPGTLLDEVLAKLLPQALEHEVKVIKQYSHDLPLVLADPDRLEQIVVNLLDNALRFTPSAGTITVDVQPGPLETTFQIRDSGIGIPPQDLPHVFDRFFKADKARTLEKGGTGLGLAIVKELVEAHRGRIEVVSKQEQGTEFSFSIPNA